MILLSKMHETPLTQKSLSNQAAFCWSMWQNCVKNYVKYMIDILDSDNEITPSIGKSDCTFWQFMITFNNL